MTEINFRNCTIELTPYTNYKLKVYVSKTLTIEEIVKNSQLKDFPFSDDQKESHKEGLALMQSLNIPVNDSDKSHTYPLFLIIIGKNGAKDLLNSIVHETMHVVQALLRDCLEIEMDRNTDELYAYSMSWLVEKIWNEVGR